MRKILSTILSVLLIVGTLSCLTMLPAHAEDTTAVNLIVNGNADGVDGKVLYDETDEKTSSYMGEFDSGAPVGWRDLSAEYCNTKLFYPATLGVAEGSYKNYSATAVIGLNSWQQLAQDVRIEAGKTYKVSAKVTINEGNTKQTGRMINMGLDAKTQLQARSFATTMPWYTSHALTFSDVANKAGNGTTTWTGDFADISFTFNADDFIKYHKLTAGDDNKYHARLVFENYCTGWALFDDITMYEVTPFTADVANQNGIYGGYVKGDKAGVIGQSATVTAVPYYGNTFEGWYSDNKRVSTDLVYTFTVAANTALTAKFNINNLWPDSGYENTAAETPLLYNTIGGKSTDGLWYSDANSVWWSGKVSTEKAAEGKNSAAITHRNNYFCFDVDVAANTDYIFSFDWLIKSPTTSNGNKPSDMREVKISDKNGITIVSQGVNAQYNADFQNTAVAFNSGDNTSITVTLLYYADSSAVFLDNLSIVPGTANNDYVKVTYDSGDAVVGSHYECCLL